MPPRRKKAGATNGEVASSKKRQAKTQQTVTSKQRLSTIIKRVRDKLREDAGISTDAERLPQLTWMLFLKFLDDHEKAQEEELGNRHVPVIEAPYRWRDWAVPATSRPPGKATTYSPSSTPISSSTCANGPVAVRTTFARSWARSSGAHTTSSVRAISSGKSLKRSAASISTLPTTFTSCRTSTRRC